MDGGPIERPARREHQRVRPLRRKPKTLDEAPTLFDASGNGAGPPMSALGDRRRGGAKPDGKPGSTGMTEDSAGTVDAEREDEDPEAAAVKANARRIAARLALKPPRGQAEQRRGHGSLVSTPYRANSDDIDLDRTLEILTERPVPEDSDIVVRDRVKARRAVLLAVDVSGSMKGERVRTAAATVGALASELRDEALGVVAFWSDAAVLQRVSQGRPPMKLLDDLLRIPARGLTNVGFPLEVAASELSRWPGREARVVLLSDCVHNAGPDPRPLAARLPRLDVLLDVTGEHDIELAGELARAGRGRLRRVRTHRDVAPALTAMLTP